MSETRWTKGPWIACLHGGGITSEHGDVIAIQPEHVWDEYDCDPARLVYSDADAHLIAAAPDLAEALRLLLADVEDYPAWQRPCHAVDVALAALAKAKGEGL